MYTPCFSILWQSALLFPQRRQFTAQVHDLRNSIPAGIAEVVVLDVGLTAKLLSLVNSSVYALPREISSVEQAVALLGAEQVRNAAVAVSVISKFTESKSW